MEQSNQDPGGSSLAHKAAAVALAICSLIVGLVIYWYFIIDDSSLRDCISRGGSGSTCSGGSWRLAIPFFVVLGGVIAAAKVWRGRR
jgi:hypothetical protein